MKIIVNRFWIAEAVAALRMLSANAAYLARNLDESLDWDKRHPGSGYLEQDLALGRHMIKQMEESLESIRILLFTE